MRTIPTALLTLLNSDAQAAAWAVLLHLDLSDVGDTQLRYARYTETVTYDGEDYTPWPSAGQWLFSGKGGSVPTVSLTLPDAVRVVRPYAIATDWFRDCTVTVAIVNVDNLAADYAWSTVTYDILAAKPQGEDILMTLGGANPVKMRSPANRYWSDQCPYAGDFKTDPRCGYSGAETTCNGTLARCVALGKETRFGGFLGLDPDAAKIVIPARMKG